MEKITAEEKFKDARAKKAHQAPIIDLEMLSHNPEEVEKLYQALVNTGFMYISNHGVDKDFIEEIKQVTYDFYHLSPPKRKELQEYEGKLVHSDTAFDLPPFVGIVEKDASIDVEYVDTLFHKYISEISKLAFRLFCFFETALGLEKGLLSNRLGITSFS